MSSGENGPDPSGGLRLVRRTDHFGMPYTEVVAADPASLARVCYSVVAVTLAEPLRRAVCEHLDAHGCGVLSCPEAQRLFALLPDGDRILLA